MESGNGAASGEGILIPVSESSDDFQSKILAPLQNAYLYEESEQSFRYKSAVLVKNPDLEDKYNSFRAWKRNAGYSEEELDETYGFLLFDDGSKANAVGETGVISGNNTCTTLGDPAKGVYISMYSDCLDLNRWYHGKSGYIAIIRLTKGKVKSVAENYTQNFTEPTVGFDCHVSEQLPTVSAKTSSFLAFERTQFYLYELPQDGSSGGSRPLSAAYPFAVVSFSYMDTKTSAVLQERSEVEKQVSHYLPWRGQLLIESHFYHVELISAAGASIPAQLPPVIKVKQAIPMSVLRDLLPRAVFETSYTEEVFLEGFYCSLCEFVPSEANQANSFALLLSEIREKEIVSRSNLVTDYKRGITQRNTVIHFRSYIANPQPSRPLKVNTVKL
ncbi:protein TASOR-like [Fundulus diaphanus]